MTDKQRENLERFKDDQKHMREVESRQGLPPAPWRLTDEDFAYAAETTTFMGTNNMAVAILAAIERERARVCEGKRPGPTRTR